MQAFARTIDAKAWLENEKVIRPLIEHEKPIWKKLGHFIWVQKCRNSKYVAIFFVDVNKWEHWSNFWRLTTFSNLMKRLSSSEYFDLRALNRWSKDKGNIEQSTLRIFCSYPFEETSFVSSIHFQSYTTIRAYLLDVLFNILYNTILTLSY